MESDILDEVINTNNNDPFAGLRKYMKSAVQGGVSLAAAVEKAIPDGASEEHSREVIKGALMEGTASTIA